MAINAIILHMSGFQHHLPGDLVYRNENERRERREKSEGCASYAIRNNNSCRSVEQLEILVFGHTIWLGSETLVPNSISKTNPLVSTANAFM